MNNHTESRLYRRPTRVILNPNPMQKGVCWECKAVLPTDPGLRALTQHMVTVHGYRAVGEQVFKPLTCCLCGGAALYKSTSGKLYCKLHKAQAAQQQAVVQRTYDKTVADPKSVRLLRQERRRRRAAHLKEVKA